MPKNKKYYKKGDDFHSTATHRKLTGGARNNCEMKEMGGQKVVMDCAKTVPTFIELTIAYRERVDFLEQTLMTISPTIYDIKNVKRVFK
ncbi:hypothetical protein [Helicobacter cetorum]|uniref:hypothetical protein n=1 Tax=Helicobacter cetorum TaxID=138563 RepID=UPI000CF0801B|nr:hypothetical protein [Helicobacter cetorum]